MNLAISVPELFRGDVEKSTWKKIKKLVCCSGLENYIYEDPVEREVEISKQEERSQIKQARIERFNHGYRTFIEQLSQAFPRFEGDGSTVSLAALDEFHRND